MHGARELDGRSRWWVNGGAALLVHGVIVLAMPDAPRRQPVMETPLVWLNSTLAGPPAAPESAAATQSDSVAAASAASSDAPRRMRPARAAVARPRRSVRASSEQASHEEPAATTRPQSLESAPARAAGSSAATAHGALAVVQAMDGASGAANPGAAAGASLGLASLGHAGAGMARKPGLLALRNPCSGYFPASASADRGAVQISVDVDATGHTSAARVLGESPAGQEFGRAARACAASLRFVPAADGTGAPIAGAAKLELRFSRS